MKHKTDRRLFLKESLTLGAAAVLGGKSLPSLWAQDAASPADLAVVKGADAYASTLKAVELVGGMSKFVTKGARVGLLVNAPGWWKLPGSHVDTDIVLAAVRMFREAGAKQVLWLQDPAPDFWSRSPLSSQRGDDIKSLTPCSGRYIDKDVKGVALKTARVIRDLFDCDAFVNISIAKDHTGTRFSGVLKNFMGALTEPSFKFFHFGSGKNKGEYDDVEHLSQCIADVNLLRRPSLCLADATRMLATNGPAGPGELVKPGKVVAGADPVAVDTLGAGILGRKPDEIVMLKMAAAHGLGATDLARRSVKEVAL